MFYLMLDVKNISNIREVNNMAKLFLEVDTNGFVKREIGINDKGCVVHVAPTEKDNYGLFDNQPFSKENLISDISEERFEELWRGERKNGTT